MANRMECFLPICFWNITMALAIIVFGVAVVPPTASHGQSPQPMSFVPVAPDQLSNSSVHCFFKDSHGYMWIGTEDDGLIRYDGTNAYRYLHDPTDRTSLPHSTVNTIAESPEHQLWIGTARGLCRYDRELDRFVNVDSIKGNRNYLNNRFITDLAFDRQGKIWIGTHEGGINIYDPAIKEFSYIVDSAQGGVLPSTNFINVLLAHGDTMWCGGKGGLQLYDTRTKKRIVISGRSALQHTQVTSIAPDKYDNLWIATTDGQIIRAAINGSMQAFTQVISGEQLADHSGAITTICFDRNGNILAGGEDFGLSFIDRETHRLKTLVPKDENEKYLPTTSIQSLYADDLGYVWIGTVGHGAFVFDSIKKKFMPQHAFETSPFANSDVRSLAEDRSGDIWIAFYGAGLGKINSKTGMLERTDKLNGKLTSKKITSLICSQKQDLWVGTAGKGVFRINLKDQQCVNYTLESDGFGNNQVYCLYEDKQGVIWAGTWGSGLFFFDNASGTFVNATEYNQPNHIPNTAYVTHMLQDSAGTFWIATLYGLYELKRKGIHTFTYTMHAPEERDGTMKGSQVYAIAEDRNQNLWIGTNEGLQVKRKRSTDFLLYKMQTTSGVNTIRSVIPDRFGNIWLGGSIGLSKFDTTTKSFVNYTRDDGLKSNNFQRNAALASRSGKLFFGSNAGFDSFFPENISVTSLDKPIVLTDFKINNQSVKPGVADSPLKKQISTTSDLTLAYDQRSFVIDFAVLDPGQPAHYSYCYKLEGFDETWNCFGPNNSATYTNINPGDYVFMVKASNRDGAWTKTPLTLNITIRQVVWKTWWAYTIYIMLLAVVTYVLLKIRVERLKMKNEITLEKLKREQEHELSESKNQFFTNVAHEFRTPISLILLPLETLVDADEIPKNLHRHIITAYRNADRMKRLVNELLDFNKLEAGSLQLHVQYIDLSRFVVDTCSSFNEMAQKRNIKFLIVSEADEITGWLDADKLERVIFNVLSNAFKFTADGGEITVRLRSKAAITREGNLLRSVVIVIEDNGIGISPEELPRIFDKFYQAKSSGKISSPGTGIGLSFSKALVELHRGSISVESIPDHTTNFTIAIPIDAAAYGIDELVAETLRVESGYLTAPIESPAHEDTLQQDFADKPRILIAEDNDELRNFLATELQTEFAVLQAKDGEEALSMSFQFTPDLIISDIMMPRKDGIELCSAVKSDLKTCHIPFILLTARATIEDQINGIKTGADLYVPKPFSIRYLTAHIRQIINSRQKMYARFSQDVYLMPGKIASNALDQAFLQKAIDYIIINLKDPQLSVDSIASLFNLSRMQVYRKIKAMSGKSVVEFIRMVRMKQAIKLMDAHNLTLSEIAFEVGFNSPSYFTRCFKEEFGKAPSEYLGTTNV